MIIFLERVLAVFLDNLTYGAIVILMAIESSFIPLPSEIVIPPAAYLAAKGTLNIWLVILMGVIGSLIGATFNYVLSRTLGREIIYRFARSRLGRMCFLSEHKLQQAEDYFLNYGKTSTFIGRLVPVIRHLISIPAGLAKMNFWHFLLYTFLGATIWNLILGGLGYFFGANEMIVRQYLTEISYTALFIFILLCVWWAIRKRKKNKLFISRKGK